MEPLVSHVYLPTGDAKWKTVLDFTPLFLFEAFFAFAKRKNRRDRKDTFDTTSRKIIRKSGFLDTCDEPFHVDFLHTTNGCEFVRRTPVQIFIVRDVVNTSYGLFHRVWLTNSQ